MALIACPHWGELKTALSEHTTQRIPDGRSLNQDTQKRGDASRSARCATRAAGISWVARRSTRSTESGRTYYDAQAHTHAHQGVGHFHASTRTYYDAHAHTHARTRAAAKDVMRSMRCIIQASRCANAHARALGHETLSKRHDAAKGARRRVAQRHAAARYVSRYPSGTLQQDARVAIQAARCSEGRETLSIAASRCSKTRKSLSKWHAVQRRARVAEWRESSAVSKRRAATKPGEGRPQWTGTSAGPAPRSGYPTCA